MAGNSSDGTEQERPIEYDGYPEHVTQSKCNECNEIFYHRYHAEYCPYCGAGDDDSLTVLNIGSGVVCHRPPRPAETTCVVCGKDLTDPKNAGDPDENGGWVCTRNHCRAVHDVPMTVERTVNRTQSTDTEDDRDV